MRAPLALLAASVRAPLAQRAPLALLAACVRAPLALRAACVRAPLLSPDAAAHLMAPPSTGCARALEMLLACAWLLDALCGVFIVSAGVHSLSNMTGAPPAQMYPRAIVGIALILLGVAHVLASLFRIALLHDNARFLYRFFGKGLTILSSGALIFSLEEPRAAVTWRGVCAVVLTVVGCAYALAACASCGGPHPRPLIYCGPSEKSDAPPPQPHARAASPFEPPPPHTPSYMLPIPAAAVARASLPPRSKYPGNPFVEEREQGY